MKRTKHPPDPRGGHVRLYNTLIDSPAWNALSATDQRVYVALRRALGKSNNGDISLPLSRSKHFQIRSPSTLAKGLLALVAVGLIAVTRRGGCTRGGQRLATLYRFTDEQVYEMKPKLIDAFKATNEWQAVGSIAEGKARIKAAEDQASTRAAEKARSRNRMALVQPANQSGPKSSTRIEAWR
jgi:hypothetical protein